MAAIEAEWDTSKASAAFNAVALLNQKEQKNNFDIPIPAVLGVIATHSTDTEITGIKAILYGKKTADGTRDPNIHTTEVSKQGKLLMFHLKLQLQTRANMKKYLLL